MNRRNFVVGLGTVATVSGVASVTAASFANSVTSGADFRVVVDEQLVVERGDTAENNNSEYWDDTNLNEPTGDADFETAVDESAEDFAVFVNNSQDTDLQINLAALNDDDIGLVELNGLLKVDNQGSTDEDVQITFNFGTDVGSEEGNVSEQTVLDLFTFVGTAGDEEISPATYDGGQQEPTDSLTVAAGEEEEIDLNVDLGTTASDLAADANLDPFDGGAEQTLDLVEEINVGTDFDDTDGGD